MAEIKNRHRFTQIYYDFSSFIMIVHKLEEAKKITQKRFPNDAWEAHNGAEAHYNEKYDKEEEERRINA